jgi:fructose-1,6-bisphosphatase/inositol monophosphatase family enzyme
MDNLHDICKRLIEITHEAGRLLLDKRGQNQIHVSDWREFVTSADLDADKLIKGRLKEHYPDVPIFSEESGGERISKGWIFVVDAIDGTNNYAKGTDRGLFPLPP